MSCCNHPTNSLQKKQKYRTEGYHADGQSNNFSEKSAVAVGRPDEAGSDGGDQATRITDTAMATNYADNSAAAVQNSDLVQIFRLYPDRSAL
jgi:hypothetical protein